MPKELKEKYMVCSAKLVINRHRGIVGIFGEDVYTEYDLDDDFEPENEAIVEIEVKVPFTLFEPMKMKIEVPEDFRKGAIQGEVEKVQIPLELAEVVTGKSECFEVTELNSESHGLLATLARKVGESLDKMRTKEELAQIEEARKKKAREQLDKRIAQLQKMKEEL